MSELANDLVPKMVRLMLPCSGKLIGDVKRELDRVPEGETGAAHEFYPSMQGQMGSRRYSNSLRYAHVIPELKAAGLSLNFDFLRYSTLESADASRYQLDALPQNSEEATGPLRTWRLVVNLALTPHVLRYIARPASDLELTDGRGYEGCPPADIVEGAATEVELSKRSGNGVSGLLIASSEVLYGGVTDGPGYLASYVAVEPVAA